MTRSMRLYFQVHPESFLYSALVTDMGRKYNPDLERRVSSFAMRIRDLREDHDLTQEEVANLLYIGQRTYADYELGKIRIPVDSLIILAKYYDIDMNYICGVSRKKAPFPKDTPDF